MGKVGRVFCVALPFILTLLSLIALLIACLGGVTNKGLYMFRVDMTELSVSPDNIRSLINDAISGRDVIGEVADVLSGGGSNITAEDIGLRPIWDVSVWNYCTEDSDGENRKCLEPKYNWAASTLDVEIIEKLENYSGGRIDVPDEITTALNAFINVSRWTQIVFIIALVALGLQLVVGMFATCTRIASCITVLIASISTTAVGAAAALSTATAVVVVGAVEGTAKVYGVRGSFNTTFLALVWIAVAFALAAGLFWLFTICCCAPDHSSRKSRKGGDAEKFAPTGSYVPLQNDPYGARDSHYGQQQPQHQYGAPRYPSGVSQRSQMAYEPYSHR